MVDAFALGLAKLGAALPLVGGVIGSSMGMYYANSVAVNVLAEDPKQFRNALFLSALPMTQTFYGLIQMLYILEVFLPKATVDLTIGLAVLGLGLVGFAAELFSAMSQGKICAHGISELIRTQGKILTNAVLMAVYVELWGILGIVFVLLGLSLLG
ncbi:MAG: ATPase [Desulfurococcales archaeon]|jgi:V/A-type H+-transporting ATPase subunit K|nr:ATPase [Desulfurococcales archaeon]